MRKSKAFTLIELIAVLVILAILALIVTSLVLNIIRKARISADKRSIDAYGKEETVTYDAYEVGDEVTYNNVNYYVIKDSGTSEANVTLLKATPLTTAEVNVIL